MDITNNTSNTYYIGSHYLAPEGDLTLSDSEYNNNDAIANQVNYLDTANNISVASAPSGYPRSTGSSGGSSSGTAGGDLSGTYPNPDVAIVDDGVLGSGTPSADTVLLGDRTWALPSAVLLYDYTVAGAAKASIDTGADTPDAGIAGTSAFPSGFRVLEMWLYGRTDSATTYDSCILNFNNDSTAIYDRINIRDTNTTLAQDNSLAQTAASFNLAGNSLAANYFGTYQFTIPNYSGAVGYKAGYFNNGVLDSTAANTRIQTGEIAYRSTSAITRLAVAPFTGGKKFLVGTRLMIFAR